MSLTKTKIQEIIGKFGKDANDTASTSVQIALLTERLDQLNTHFRDHKRDFHSRTGLLRIVGQRRRLLSYLHRKDAEEYKKVISALGLRK